MGRARRNRRNNNRNENRINNINEPTGNRDETGDRDMNRTRPIDDCFALYILFKKLHMLFVY